MTIKLVLVDDHEIVRFGLRTALDGAQGLETAPPASDAAQAATKLPAFGLSEREIEVLHLLVDGLSNAEIANRLVIGPQTVKTHMRHIMEKLRVSDRTQAAVKAMRQGLF